MDAFSAAVARRGYVFTLTTTPETKLCCALFQIVKRKFERNRQRAIPLHDQPQMVFDFSSNANGFSPEPSRKEKTSWRSSGRRVVRQTRKWRERCIPTL